MTRIASARLERRGTGRLGSARRSAHGRRPLVGVGEIEVVAAGIDTWSLCWSCSPGSSLHIALRRLATEKAGRALLMEETIRAHRIGWFPDHGLVFVEGRPGEGDLCLGSGLASRAALLVEEMRDLGIPVPELSDARVRRLDVAVDLWMGSSVEGLALLECVGNLSISPGKVVTYRQGHTVQTIVLKSPAGRSQARLYDKGVQREAIQPGKWLRFEAQWRFGKSERPGLRDLDALVLRERFRRRFTRLLDADGGFEVGGVDALATRLSEAVETGRLAPSRARSVAGYLLLSAAGVPQGAGRTRRELEHECRELGLSISLAERSTVGKVDIAGVLEQCLVGGIWGLSEEEDRGVG